MVDGGSIAIGAIIQEVSAEAVSGVQPQAFSSPGKPPARNLVHPASPSRTRLGYEWSRAFKNRRCEPNICRFGLAIWRRFGGVKWVGEWCKSGRIAVKIARRLCPSQWHKG